MIDVKRRAEEIKPEGIKQTNEIKQDTEQNIKQDIKPTWEEHLNKQKLQNISGYDRIRKCIGTPYYKMMMKDITPRLYQETVIGSCVDKNCMVVLPTGMGKTVVALMLASQRLKTFPNSKVLFLAPTKPLVEQHLVTFEKHFDIDPKELAVFTGSIKPEKRAKMWDESKIFFSTPQGLENDIITSRINLKDVSLIIFDEAHRATGEYAYNFIAKQYNKKARYPKILALTASPGSDMEKINEVCENLFIEDVEVRTDKDPDVAPYIQNTNVKWVTVDFPEEFKGISKHLKNCINTKLKDLKELGVVNTEKLTAGKLGLLRAQAGLQAEVAKGNKTFEALKSISLLAEAMKAEHAVELIETQGIEPLIQYFDSIYTSATTSTVKAVKNLAKDVNFKSAFILTKRLLEEEIEHPKQDKLKEIVIKQISQKKDSKIIIFSQFRDSAKKITDDLCMTKISGMQTGIKAKLFVGQAKKKGIGLSQKEQKQMLDEFRNGEFNCLVATSVAEEGIDIPCVDSVIFYEPVPSGIRTIQRRGRTGRQEKGEVIVLMTKGTRDEGYKWSAHHKEKRMYRELENLKVKFRGRSTKVDDSLNKYFSPDIDVTIFADSREKGAGIIKEIADKGMKIKLQTMTVGDYLLSDRVCVEFKKVKDFVDSIIDARLLEQIKQLRLNYERPIVVIEGEEDIYSQRNIHSNAIRGMISTIMVSYGIPIIQTKNTKDTAALFAVIAKREQEESNKEFSPHANKKISNDIDIQEYIVSSLPKVGIGLAKPLLKEFGSVSKIFNATEEELMKIDKIGKGKASEIRRIIDKEYK